MLPLMPFGTRPPRRPPASPSFRCLSVAAVTGLDGHGAAALALAGLLSLGLLTSALARTAPSTHPENPHRTRGAYASLYAFDARTGTPLLEVEAETPRAPASLTKMMTLLLLVEAVDRGEFRWEDTVVVPWQSAQIGGSGVGLVDRERISLGDAAKALIVSSGNDAAIAIAEHVARSESIWVQRMNRRARELGMRATVYRSSHGLDGWARSSMTTAKDQGILVRELLRHPQILAWTSARSMVIRGGQALTNTNKLLGVFPGLDGIKTGVTGKAGYCLASTAERDGFRIGCILLGSGSSADRFAETQWALTEAFLRYRLDLPVTRGMNVATSIPVAGGAPPTISAVATEDLPVLRARADTTALQVVVVPRTGLSAPLTAGTPVAYIEVIADGRLLTRGEAVASGTVRRPDLWERIRTWFRRHPWD